MPNENHTIEAVLHDWKDLSGLLESRPAAIRFAHDLRYDSPSRDRPEYTFQKANDRGVAKCLRIRYPQPILPSDPSIEILCDLVVCGGTRLAFEIHPGNFPAVDCCESLLANLVEIERLRKMSQEEAASERYSTRYEKLAIPPIGPEELPTPCVVGCTCPEDVKPGTAAGPALIWSKHWRLGGDALSEAMMIVEDHFADAANRWPVGNSEDGRPCDELSAHETQIEETRELSEESAAGSGDVDRSAEIPDQGREIGDSQDFNVICHQLFDGICEAVASAFLIRHEEPPPWNAPDTPPEVTFSTVADSLRDILTNARKRAKQYVEESLKVGRPVEVQGPGFTWARGEFHSHRDLLVAALASPDDDMLTLASDSLGEDVWETDCWGHPTLLRLKIGRGTVWLGDPDSIAAITDQIHANPTHIDKANPGIQLQKLEAIHHEVREHRELTSNIPTAIASVGQSIESLDLHLHGIPRQLEALGNGVAAIQVSTEAIAKNEYELRKENAELMDLAKGGFFRFATRIEAGDFRAFAAIMLTGNRNRAAKALGIPKRSFYDLVESWPSRGPDYRRMHDMVEWRKKSGRKIKVRLDDSLLGTEITGMAENPETIREVLAVMSEKTDTMNQDDLLRDILQALTCQDDQNWQSIKAEVIRLIREEVPQ